MSEFVLFAGSHIEVYKTKKPKHFCFGFQRRERDSNPRIREDQRFSRPPHSTTLPSLRVCGDKSRRIFLSAKILGKKITLFLKKKNQNWFAYLNVILEFYKTQKGTHFKVLILLMFQKKSKVIFKR